MRGRRREGCRGAGDWKSKRRCSKVSEHSSKHNVYKLYQIAKRLSMIDLLQRLDGRVGSLHSGGGRSQAGEHEEAKKT